MSALLKTMSDHECDVHVGNLSEFTDEAKVAQYESELKGAFGRFG